MSTQTRPAPRLPIVDVLTPELKTALTEPFAIVMDDSDMKRLGMFEVNQTAKINGKEVKINNPNDANDLGIGMDVELDVPGGKAKGRLASISPEVVGSEVLARVAFADAQPQGLRQNQRVSARVLIENKPDVLMVRRGPFVEQTGGRFAWLVRDGIAERQPVRLGDSSLPGRVKRLILGATGIRPRARYAGRGGRLLDGLAGADLRKEQLGPGEMCGVSDCGCKHVDHALS